MLGFLMRVCDDMCDPYTLKSLYCTLVRSLLEYCSVVWAPYYDVHKNRIESLQRKFVRYALRKLGWTDPLRLPPYVDRCGLIDLETLEFRRKNAFALFAFDLISGRTRSEVLLSRIRYNVPHPRRSRVPVSLVDPLYVDLHRTMYGDNEPLNRACMAFNELRESFDFGITRDTFHKRIKSSRHTLP